MHDGDDDKSKVEDSKTESEETNMKNEGFVRNYKQEYVPTSDGTGETTYDIPDFGEMTPEARQYILNLHSRLSTVKKVHFEKKKIHFVICIVLLLIYKFSCLIVACIRFSKFS